MLALRCLLILLLPLTALAAEQTRFSTQSGDDINLVIYPAASNTLFIWLPSEAGPQLSEIKTAEKLATQGTEVWRLDLLEDYFLPMVASSLEQIPAATISDLIQHAITKTQKQVYLVSSGRGTIPMLRGARHWQQQHPAQLGLGGAIFISPEFFVETPDPGMSAALMPVVSASNLPLFILQPEQSPWFWQLGVTIPALELGGSQVFVRRLPGVRDRFNFRPDASVTELELSAHLDALLLQAHKLLSPYALTPRRAVAQTTEAPTVTTEKKDRVLQAYKGEARTPELRLNDLNDTIIDLKALSGKVVLVNFWASWCPPCVHEMPSMQRLSNKLKQQPFVILGVNMAEDKQTIKNFLSSEVSVNFPILLDSKGAALKSWGVFAFPTSYVVDKQGRIRYALFGSIEWDSSEIVNSITTLLNER